MTVESYVMVRARRNNDGAWGLHENDTAPYQLSGEDVTARAANITDGPLHLSAIEAHPQILIWRFRMSNADALAMSTDPKLWMIESRRYDAAGEEQENNKDEAYSAAERTLRINQLATFTGFDVDQITAWWTPEKTRREVALKLRDYLGKIN